MPTPTSAPPHTDSRSVPNNDEVNTALRCFSIRPGPDTIEATLLRPLDNNALASVQENLSETPLRPT